MAIWQVSLLGSPQARGTGNPVTLRSRQTWALLASLLLEPDTTERGILAVRFWPEGRDSRKSLGMALVSLREAFGEESFQTDRQTIQLQRDRFCVDIDQIGALQIAARKELDSQKRLTLLLQAASLLRGRFLEGADLFADGDGFMARQQERCKGMGAEVLLALARVQEQREDKGAAFETLVRALRIHPENGIVVRTLWHIGENLGRQKVTHQFLQEFGAGDLLAEPHPKQEESVILPASKGWCHLLESLAVFSSPFTVEMARKIDYSASQDVLHALSQQLYLLVSETDVGQRYIVPLVIRKRLWEGLKRERQKNLGRAYFQCIHKYLIEECDKQSENVQDGGIIRRLSLDIPHFAAILTWITQRKVSHERLEFIHRLQYRRFPIAENAREWVESVAKNNTLEIRFRAQACRCAGDFARDRLDFRAARQWYLEYSLLNQGAFEGAVTTLAEIAMACHHAGIGEEAILCARDALRLAEESEDEETIAYTLFVLVEVSYTIAPLAETLAASQRIVAIRKNVGLRLSYAAALYQWGIVQLIAEEGAGALKAWDEAISIFYEQDDQHGVADCLRQMALIRSKDGLTGEAFALAQQAKMIYERLNNTGSRAAILEVLGDIRKAQGNQEAARSLYEESLAHWNLAQHPRWITRLNTRLKAL